MDCGVKHRGTKAVVISENVLVSYPVVLLLKELGTNFFSIASDASNKDNRKFYPFFVRYFNPAVGVPDRVLDFYEDVEEASLAIHKKIWTDLRNQVGLEVVKSEI
jgi:hypothetical protein